MRSVEKLIDIYECWSQVFAVKARTRARGDNDVVGMEKVRSARIAPNAYRIGVKERRVSKANINARAVEGCLKLANQSCGHSRPGA